jgi:flagellar biosynthesis/type III secretory pathway M-ring protein FliF/YscJ
MLVSILVPLAAVTAYNAHPRTDEFEALASGLTRSESDAVLGHLEDRHVPYVLLDGGQTVMVPATKRAELTVELTRLAFVRDGLFPVRGNDLTADRELSQTNFPAGAQAQHRTGSAFGTPNR